MAIVKLLMAAGANPDLTDNDGLPPLLHAVSCRQVEVVKILIEHANVNPKAGGTEWSTSLDLAAMSGRVDIVRILLGCHLLNPDALCDKRRTPLHCAAILTIAREY